MQPRSQKHEIAPSIGILLALYWQPDEAPGTRLAIAEAWLEELVEFEMTVVAEACRDWRRSQTRRPLLAEIFKSCREGQENADWRRQRALPPPQPQAGEAPAWFTADMQKDWSWPEYEGDERSPWQRRSAAIARQQAKRLSPEEMQRGGRALCDQWARQQGYADFTAAERAGHQHSEVVSWVIANAQPRNMPLAPGEERMSAAEKERIRRNTLLEQAA